MYEQVFNFRSRPFTTTPFVKHYFAGSAIEQSLGQARLCIDRASGPVVLVGDIGTGKSLFLAMLEDQFKAQFLVVNLGCARLESRKDLLQSILFELDRPIVGRTEAELRFDLMAQMKPSEKCPLGMLLLVDDAEALSVELIDELRLILNNVVDGNPRARLVMAGKHGLEERLTDPKLASFSQRIATRCYLAPFSSDETASYVLEHVTRAGGSSSLFLPEALSKIHELTHGVPRLINQVCDFALIIAGTRNQQSLDVELISEAWADVQSIPDLISSPANSHADSAKSDWTVIEFGELDDDEPGTVYEFGGTQQRPTTIDSTEAEDQHPNAGLPVATSSSISDLDPPHSEECIAPVAQPPIEANVEPNVEPAWNNIVPDDPAPSLDPDLGVDLGALQRRHESLQSNPLPAEPEEIIHAPEITPAINQRSSSSSDTGLTGPSDEGQLDEADLLAQQLRESQQRSQMAAQFAAVFGKEPETEQSGFEESELGTPEPKIEMPSLAAPVESAPAIDDANDSSPNDSLARQLEANRQLFDEQQAILDQVASSSPPPVTRAEQTRADELPSEVDSPAPPNVASTESPDTAYPPPMDVASFVRPPTTTAIASQIADAFGTGTPSQADLYDEGKNELVEDANSPAASVVENLTDAPQAELVHTDPDHGMEPQQFTPAPSIGFGFGSNLDAEAQRNGPNASDAENAETPQSIVHETQTATADQLVDNTAEQNQPNPEPGIDLAALTESLKAARDFDAAHQPTPAAPSTTNEGNADATDSHPSVEINIFEQHEISKPSVVEQTHHNGPSEYAHETLEKAAAPIGDSVSTTEEATYEKEITPELNAPNPLEPTLRKSSLDDDPFAESFAQEETLLDRFAPIISAQNQSSASLSSSDLVFVRPLDLETEGSPDASHGKVSARNTGTSQEPQEVEAESEQREILGSESLAEATGCAVVRPVASTMSFDSTTHPDEAIHNSEIAAKPAVETAGPEVTSDQADGPQFHEHITEAANEEISRQADEILRRLTSNKPPINSTPDERLPVSHETHVKANPQENSGAVEFFSPRPASPTDSPADPSEEILNEIQQQAELLKSSQLPVVESTSHIGHGASTQPHSKSPGSMHEENQPDRSPDPVDERSDDSPSTLAHPMARTPHAEQDSGLDSQVTQAEPQDMGVGSQDMGVGSQDTGVVHHGTSAEPPLPNDQPQEDPELIISSTPKPDSTAPKKTTPPIPFPETPVSTGRAERMDYQKLFDQLRNVNQNETPT